MSAARVSLPSAASGLRANRRVVGIDVSMGYPPVLCEIGRIAVETIIVLCSERGYRRVMKGGDSPHATVFCHHHCVDRPRLARRVALLEPQMPFDMDDSYIGPQEADAAHSGAVAAAFVDGVKNLLVPLLDYL